MKKLKLSLIGLIMILIVGCTNTSDSSEDKTIKEQSAKQETTTTKENAGDTVVEEDESEKSKPIDNADLRLNDRFEYVELPKMEEHPTANYTINGSVKNISGEWVSVAKIQFDILDKDGNVIAMAEDFLGEMKIDEVVDFSAFDMYRTPGAASFKFKSIVTVGFECVENKCRTITNEETKND